MLISVLSAFLAAASAEPSAHVDLVQEFPDEFRLRHRRVPIEVGGGITVGGDPLSYSPYVGTSLRAVGTLPFGLMLGLDGSLDFRLIGIGGQVNLLLGYSLTSGDWVVRPYLAGGIGFSDATSFWGNDGQVLHSAAAVEVLGPTRVFGAAIELGVARVLDRPYAEEPSGFSLRTTFTWYFL